jgi:hypothetical protein
MVVAYFKVKYWTLPGSPRKTIKTSVRITELWAKI